jgi:16S rRNA (cytosine967-C5)-methyltransferase
MAVDILGKVELTVSDIRRSILYNLEKRFATAGIAGYKRFVADIAGSAGSLPLSEQDLIICDAPCTGSGTWGRTPEQLFFFNDSEITRYAELQKIISSSAIRYLKAGGHLLYITCSVFRDENEEVVKYLSDSYNLSVLEMRVIKGYDKKADTMFAALLKKKL